MKKLSNKLLAVAIAVCAFLCLPALAACGENTPTEHSHIYATEWTADGGNHWHACTVTGCTEKKDTAAHDFTNGNCVCGREKSTEGLSYESIGGTSYSISKGRAADTDIVIPSTYNGKPVTDIEYRAFYRCDNLMSIMIGDNVASIGDEAFAYCTGLTNITIPSGVTSIGSSVFSYCTGLTSITIPSSVTSIKYYAFLGCGSLTSITFQGTKAQWNAITKFSNWDNFTANYTIHCTDGDIAKA